MLPLPPNGSVVWLAVCWLAVWRVTALITYDRGPFDIVARTRAGFARIGLHNLVTCFHCSAFWVSFAVVAVTFELQWISLLVALGVAGAASITERFLGAPVSESPEDRD